MAARGEHLYFLLDEGAKVGRVSRGRHLPLETEEVGVKSKLIMFQLTLCLWVSGVSSRGWLVAVTSQTGGTWREGLQGCVAMIY